jgi:hypothetical protein
VTTRKPSEDDSFVVAKLHKHLKQQVTVYSGLTDYSRGQRDALLDALAYLDGLSGGRYPSEGGAQ